MAGAGDAYLSNQMQVGGAVRDAKGNLKFNKNTKRGREVEKEYEDTYSGGVLEKEEVKRKKPKEVTKLGEEFRSKVSRAPNLRHLMSCDKGES
jgi:ribosomal RNA-processing protein 12